MKRSSLMPLALSLTPLLLIALAAQSAASQEQRTAPAVEEQGARAWYDQNSADAKPEKSIAQQNSESRGRQRMARLESLRRQGVYVARPTFNGLPFTNTYRPYGRYYRGHRIIIIQRSPVAYR